MKFIKSISTIVLLALVAVIYFNYTEMPIYTGQLSLDLNNCTHKTLTDIFIEFEGIDKKFALPEVRPFERIIVIAPNDVFDEPRKTRIFIYYNNKKSELLGEYHSRNNAKYDTDIAQYARVKFYNNSAKVLYKGFFDIRSNINIKPSLFNQPYAVSIDDKSILNAFNTSSGKIFIISSIIFILSLFIIYG